MDETVFRYIGNYFNRITRRDDLPRVSRTDRLKLKFELPEKPRLKPFATIFIEDLAKNNWKISSSVCI